MKELQESLSYLESPEALASISRDPYWPKWDGPWWHMLMLHEMGMTTSIPKEMIAALIKSVDENLTHEFPFTEADIPEGKDPIRGIPCHCQIGSVYQVLAAYGVNVDERLPWIRPWFLKYQMHDGGLNCDEAAYTRPVPKSSLVSSLPALEAVLYYTNRPFTPAEISFLDRGASYLLKKRLFRSETDGRILDEKWLKLSFPRFYFYDILRGLSFVLHWARSFNRTVPRGAIKESIDLIESEFPDDCLHPQHKPWQGANTQRLNLETNTWSKEPSKASSLLCAISENHIVSPMLSTQWHRCKNDLVYMLDCDLVASD